MSETDFRDFDIAIVGMSGRFPSAESVEEFWDNLTKGKDCITRDIPQDSEKEGFVPAYGRIENQEYFDAGFFGISDVEAEMLDPQQRLMLKLTQEAIEDAGIQVTRDNAIGMYAGADEFIYVWQNILGSEEFNEFDYYTRRFCLGGSLTSRVSYNMNFHGPSLTLKAACATSTVATHLACQALLNYECDVALAGGVELYTGQNGYYVAEGTISKTGCTRPFDENADGFVPGNGGALVVLKRLTDSLRDRDRIYAVIRGTAMNNDGNQKLGYTAPSAIGEYDVIRAAQEIAEVQPQEVSYIETHGTATKLGDAIEIDALRKVFKGEVGKDKPYCAIGSVKSNVGHLNTVAGIAGIIKTALMLYHKKLVPTIHFEKPNPDFRLEESPFYVNTKYCDWDCSTSKRIAGVSSFGIGGTNCHIVLQEPPVTEPVEQNNPEKLIVLSAKTSTALEKKAQQLADFIKEHETISLDEVAYTLQTGRNVMPYRRYESIVSLEDAVQHLETIKKPVLREQDVQPEVVFMFPGTAKLDKMQIQGLCEKSKVFEQELKKCLDIVTGICGKKPLDSIGTQEGQELDYSIIMSLVFSINYAMAQLWFHMGVKPKSVMGYSLGEYVAACISGALSLEDALFLVYNRGKLFEEVQDGYMMTVMSTREKLEELLIDGVEISACNAENRFSVSGLQKPMEQFKAVLVERKIPYSDISLGKPGHCSAVEEILPKLAALFKNISFHEMKIPMISTGTGNFITTQELEHIEHWTSQTRHAVQFCHAMQCMKERKNMIWLECGFGQQLYKLGRKNVKQAKEQQVVMSIPGNEPPYIEFLNAVGQIWQYGGEINWDQLYDEKPYKVSMPAYPFEEKYYYNVKKRKFAARKVHQDKKASVLYDGLSEQRFELAKHLAGKEEKLYILMKQLDKKENGYSLTQTMQEQVEKIKEIERDALSKSEVRCMWQYDGLIEAYDELCQSCAADYFKACHLFQTVNESISLEEAYKRANLIEEYKPLFHLLLKTLEQDGHICVLEGMVTVNQSLEDIPEQQACFEKQVEKFPDFKAHMKLLLTCSSRYEEVLSGRVLGKEVLYPQGSYEQVLSSSAHVPTTTKIYEYCDILAQSLKHMTKFKTQKIRILEFGAGTGLITWKLAEALKDCDIEYYFTDVGRSFITAAQKVAKEKGYDFIKFARFDITKPIEEQDIPCGAFDFVVSCNVIQAMDDMESALSNIAKALSKNGTLCLLQTVWGHKSTEMIFGLCKEWWNYTTDKKRVDTPVMSYDGWRTFLESQNFENIMITPEKGISDLAFLFAQYQGSSDNAQTGVLYDAEEKIRILKEINANVEVISVKDYTAKETEEIIRKLREKHVIDEIIQLSEGKEVKENVNACITRNQVDEEVIDILYEVVGLIPESLEQEIFELDVDSLSGLIISTKIRSAFHISFTIKELLSCKNIKDLSDYIVECQETQKQEQKQQEEKSVQRKNKKSISDLMNEL